MHQLVDVYIWSLTTPTIAAEQAVLSPDEEARMVRFVRSTDQQAFLAARAGLRRVLGQIAGIAAEDLTFTYGEQGKPALPDGPCFNLSHAGGRACLAVHPDLPLGIDIEEHRKVEPAVAQRFFSASENAVLSKASGDCWQTLFFQCWTRKEAVIKALGGGLSIPLDAFDVTLDRPAALTRLDPAYGNAGDWAIASFDLGTQMPGAIAMKTGGAALQINCKSCPPDIPFHM